MVRFFLIFSPLLLFFSLIFSMSAYGANDTSRTCRLCHKELYLKAIASPYKHSLIKNNCTTCHNIENTNDSRVVASPNYQKTIILGLNSLLEKGEILNKNNKYELRVEASDLNGDQAKPVVIDISKQKIWNRPKQTFNINKISKLKIESIARGKFAKAVITWTTDVPATSEVEYGSFTKNKRVFTSKNIFSRKHKISLLGLSNKGKFLLRVTSRDLNGNALQSKNLLFETHSAFNFRQYPDVVGPKIAQPMLFNIGNAGDLFIRLSANTPVKFKMSMTDIQNKAQRPCADFKQTINSTIKVCLKCHPRDASHPVGVRSKNPNVKVSSELPTIENGLITCASCHQPHGGTKKYYLRIDFTKEICIKCHLAYY